MFWFKVILGGLLAALFPVLPALWRAEELLTVNVVGGFLISLSLASMLDNYAQLQWGSRESCAKSGCDPWAKRANLIFLGILILSGFERAWLPAMLPRHGLLPWLGVALVIGGAAVRISAVYTLGKSFTSSLQAASGLMTQGVYATLRHPSYLGAQVLAIGVALSLSSLLGLALAMAGLLPLIFLRLRDEEIFLAQTYGETWRKYATNTHRLIPGLY